MNNPSPTPTCDIFNTVRRLVPVRKLGLFEHLQLAERQANRLHQLLGQTGPAVNLNWLLDCPKLTVVVQPRWQMDTLSGMTTFKDGHWIVAINQNDPHARRRFTLCHELKHVLDAARDKITYAGLAEDKRSVQREQIADYFAACYLMPKPWLRQAWHAGLHDPEALAGLFNVSLAAMNIRLRYLGFLDDQPERPVASYFRVARPNYYPINNLSPERAA